MRAAPGWYEGPGSVARWWDGSQWTAMRLKRGIPGVDYWASSEKPVVAYVFAALYAVLATLQFALGAADTLRPLIIAGVALLAVAFMFLAIGLRSGAIRRIPAPVGAPIAEASLRPFAGEVEAAGSGWYPVAAGVSRWWTGKRWSWYTYTPSGIRPTFHAVDVRRQWRWTVWSLLALGIVTVGAGVGIAVLISDSTMQSVGIIAAIAGVVVVGLALLVAGLSSRQLRSLDLPADPPY